MLLLLLGAVLGDYLKFQTKNVEGGFLALGRNNSFKLVNSIAEASSCKRVADPNLPHKTGIYCDGKPVVTSNNNNQLTIGQPNTDKPVAFAISLEKDGRYAAVTDGNNCLLLVDHKLQLSPCEGSSGPDTVHLTIYERRNYHTAQHLIKTTPRGSMVNYVDPIGTKDLREVDEADRLNITQPYLVRLKGQDKTQNTGDLAQTLRILRPIGVL
ncbi:hypothetical protein PAPHI01_0960 [Pancytospora philotis]|nr:hypothetical protein PAPHI01_0960 [Pancytospora philotis]